MENKRSMGRREPEAKKRRGNHRSRTGGESGENWSRSGADHKEKRREQMSSRRLAREDRSKT